MARVSSEQIKPLVAIRTLVYNHAPYLHDYFRGILMQKTTFPFVAIVHDDASTDGSADIIREYAEKYPDIIKPIFETENQYSKHDGSLKRIMDTACCSFGSKYQALCEGDDYWTDPQKLQKQVMFLEGHPAYAMVCCNGVMSLPDRLLTTDAELDAWGWPHPAFEGELSTEELICKGGRYLFTCGMLYRSSIMNGAPERYTLGSDKPISTGDYYRQVLAAISGRVHYMMEKMIVYRRFSSPEAWSSRYAQGKISEAALKFWCSDVHMLTSMDRHSKGRYAHIIRPFQQAMAEAFLRKAPLHTSFLMENLSYVLEYSYQEVVHQKPNSLSERLIHSLGRFICHPFYPSWQSAQTVRRCFRFCCMSNGGNFIFHIGPLHILSFVRHTTKTDVYLLGKKIR